MWWIMGEVFRFVVYDDLENADIDFEVLKTESMKNLNKITNILSRLDDNIIFIPCALIPILSNSISYRTYTASN